MKTTRSVLSGLARISFLAVAFLAFGNAFCQSSEARNTSLKGNFSMAALSAWQNHSMEKVADFYAYLNLLSDENTGSELKVEIIKNIEDLFQSKNVSVIDFSGISKNNNLEQLLKIVSAQKIGFKISDQINFTEVSENSWSVNYLVEVTQNGKKSVVHVNQTIWLSQSQKAFGAKSKTVWRQVLGEMK